MKSLQQFPAQAMEEDEATRGETPLKNLMKDFEDMQVTPKKGKVQFGLARFWSPTPNKSLTPGH